jgi:putative cardiolipin synthase
MNRILSSLLVALALVVSGCATLPPPKDRVETTALTDTAETRLGRAVAPRVAENPDKTGIHALPNPRDAFAARILLARAAEKSIDTQYFIWNGDHVGYALFQALWQAAERGVRVRLLLDDMNTGGLDPTISALAAHPNVEVRLYNPLAVRDPRVLNFLTDFTRVNRRMHNKSFTADNQATVVGGRNIADEYFGAGGGLAFADLDVLAVGPAVQEVSKEFDVYWNGASAYPASSFVGPSAPDGAANLEARFAANRADPESIAYADAVRATPLVRDLLDRKLSFEWTTAQIVYDDPAKTLDTTERTDVLLFPALVRKMGRPEKALDIVSPYFVPGAGGTEHLAELAKSGIAVRILTNSLAASDEKSVHSGYATRRRDLLQAGVRLYEIRAERDERKGRVQLPVRIRLVVRPARQDARSGPQPDLRRLVQLRPALGQAEHRNGPSDQQSGARAGAGPILRCRSADAGVRGAAGPGWQQPRMDRTDCFRREALRHRAGDELVHAHGSRDAVDSSNRMAAVGDIAFLASESAKPVSRWRRTRRRCLRRPRRRSMD